MPERIQLSRRKGWRKPENTVVVARPSKWGNPFRVGQEQIESRDRAVQWFANWLTNTVDTEGRYVHGEPDYHGASASKRPSRDDIQRALAGKNLACWCPLDQPCHADVLLKLANGDSE